MAATSPVRRVKKLWKDGTAFKKVQQGVGRLVAQVDPSNKTHLTTVSHKAPVRCIPLRSSAIDSSNSAVCVLSSYGGGLLPGDHLSYHVHVQPGARLGLVTQGSNRIYRQPQQFQSTAAASCTTLQAQVDEGSLLVMAPDPVTPFATAVYRQEQHITLTHPDANLCLVDWFSAGRLASGERWQQTSLHNTTKLYMSKSEKSRPVLIDSTVLDRTESSVQTWGMDWSSIQLNAYASIVLYGEQVMKVTQRCREIQHHLAGRETSIRPLLPTAGGDLMTEFSSRGDAQGEQLLNTLSGRVLFGVSQCRLPSRLADGTNEESSDRCFHVARIAASSNEDLYRIFHYCLQPLSPMFGLEFYKDRIRAVQSSSVTSSTRQPNGKVASTANKARERAITRGRDDGTSARLSSGSPENPSSYWTAFILADSALPSGSFAHSSGLEAASQCNLLSSGSDDVARFVQSATRSTVQQGAPLIRQSHAWARKQLQEEEQQQQTGSEWKELDEYAQALLVANEPACRTSLDQGRSLLRIAMKWNRPSAGKSGQVAARKRAILETVLQQTVSCQQSGHLATVLGVVTALWELTDEQACQLLSYCAARDTVSAAVRLNLVGPLASVGMIADAQEAAEQSIGTSDLSTAAGCAPAIDAVQPCHDLLSTRLFRT